MSVPDQLDLREYKATGLVPGETPMPEDSSATTANITSTGITTASESVQPDQALVEQLMSMGFSENGCRRAAVATHNTDADAAMNWIFEHMEDADFNDPLPISASSDGASATTATESGTGTGAGLGLESAEVQGMVEMISSMGYTADQARAALKATEYDIERCVFIVYVQSDLLVLLASSFYY